MDRDRRMPIAAAAAALALLLGTAFLTGCGNKQDGAASFEKPTAPTADETRRMEEAMKQAGGSVQDAGVPR